MIKVEQRQSVQLGHLARRMSAPALAGHYHRIQRPFQPLALLGHARPHPPPVRLGKHLPACSPEVIMKLFQRNLFRFLFPHMEEKGNFKLSLFHRVLNFNVFNPDPPPSAQSKPLATAHPLQ